MRRARLTSFTLGVCTIALAATSASAAPAGMMGRRAAAPVATNAPALASTSPSGSPSGVDWSKWSPGSWKFWGKDETASKGLMPAQPVANELPSTKISPWQHPIQYFSTSMGETPLARRLAQKKSAQPAPPSDSIALDKPVGQPNAQSLIAFAQFAEQKGDIEQARSHFRQALSKWPNDVEVLRATARLEDRQGQLAVAEGLYQRAVAASPQNAGAHNDLGLCLARQGKLEQSVQALETAIHLQPDKALYRNNAATVLVEMRQDQRALAHLSAVHAPAASNYNLGQLLVARGRPQQAAMYFQTAVDLDPSMEAARVALAQATGSPVAPAQMANEVRPLPATVTPMYGPQLEPQQTVAQPSFPATARGPAWDASSAVRQPYPSSGVTGQPGVAYHTATAPRYLPPVQTQSPGTTVR